MLNRLTLYQSQLTTRRDYFKTIVGVVQMNSTQDTEKNFQTAKFYVDLCAQRDAKFVCLPENFHYQGR